MANQRRLFQLKDEKYRLVAHPSEIIDWTELYSEHGQAAWNHRSNQDTRNEYTLNERDDNLEFSGYYIFNRATERLDFSDVMPRRPPPVLRLKNKKSGKKSVKKSGKKSVKKSAKKSAKKSVKKSGNIDISDELLNAFSRRAQLCNKIEDLNALKLDISKYVNKSKRSKLLEYFFKRIQGCNRIEDLNRIKLDLSAYDTLRDLRRKKVI